MDEAKTAERATSATEWKNLKPVEVPSGHRALVRRKPLASFWKAGIVPNSLLPNVQEALATGKPLKAEDQEWTPDQLLDILTLMDRIVVDCVVEPQVHSEPAEGEERDPDKLYVDEVQFEDKAFLWQYVIGAVDDLTSFRASPDGDVESSGGGEDVGMPAEPAVGDQG